jgi:hypothetical protein
VGGQHSGTGNFIVRIVPPGESFGELVFNEIGAYQGERAWHDPGAGPHAGPHKVAVEANGAWSLVITQPVPTTDAITVPATISGAGDRVFAIHAPTSMQATVTGSDTGSSNFIAHLYGYGPTAGEWELVFNEIGPYQGQKLVSIPAGPYLLPVESNGSWSISFAS